MIEESAVLRTKEEIQNTYRSIPQFKRTSIIYISIKRFIDIIGSLVGIGLLILLYPFIAIAIKIDSPGPVIFRQERVGQYGRIFKVYKFRTMVENAEDLAKKLKKSNRSEFIQHENDPRVTKVGSFLRKYSIDELPQLINILKGEMSLVGPRPFIIEETEQCSKEHLLRLSVKPGLTGYAQVNGRNDLTLDERAEKDLYYVYNKSILLDLKILLNTVVVVLQRDGVY